MAGQIICHWGRLGDDTAARERDQRVVEQRVESVKAAARAASRAATRQEHD